MQYVIMFYEGAEEFAVRNDPEKGKANWAAWGAYAEAIAKSGLMRGGEGLQAPSTATVLRMKDGKKHVQNGPYADTKEQLAGFFVLEVPNIEVALEWAAKSPALAKGAIEVRPVIPPDAGQ